MPVKSTTCRGKVSGKPLDAYGSKQEAIEGAAYVLKRWGSKMTPYRCARCRAWHLSPADRQTRTVDAWCDCIGGDGFPKAAYDTEEDALRRADILWKEHGVHLRAYMCDDGAWHLTKG